MAEPQTTDPMVSAFASMPATATDPAVSSTTAGQQSQTPAPHDPMEAAFGQIAQQGVDPKAAPPAQGLSPEEMGTAGISGALAASPVGANPLTVGVAKAAGETAHTIGRAINAVTGDSIKWLPTSLEQPKELGSSDTAEMLGKMGESIAEFALGDEALKGVSIAEKLGIAHKITEFAQKSPTLAKLLNLGLNATRGAAAGAVTGEAHGGTQGAETGAALGAGGEVLSAGIGAAAKGIKGMISGGESAEAPIASQVGKAVKGSGIAEGAPAAEAAPPTTPPTGENIQPELQKALHDTSKQAAKDSRVPYTKPASVRDAVGTTAREVVNNSQADYKALDDASGGRWQRFKDQIDNIQRKMDEVNGIDDEAYEKLETKRNDIETSQAQMIEDIKAEGKVDPAIIDRANANYRKGMALHDLNNAVKAATKRTSVGGAVQEVVDPNALANRVSRLADVPKTGGPSRLENALGPKGAEHLISSVDSAQIATQEIKDFVPTKGLPTEATGKQALKTMVENATTAKGKITGGAKGVTDWSSVRNQFERLSPEAQKRTFGTDVDRLRMYINKQALQQSAIKYLKRGALAAGLGGAASAGAYAAKEALQ